MRDRVQLPRLTIVDVMGFQETFQDRVMPAAERAFGVLVTLIHGEVVTAEFTALWEDERYEVVEGDGFGTSLGMRTFMFDVSAAVFLGVTFTPANGDRITMVATGQQFEVLSQPGLRAVEPMSGGQRWKVRTKRVT